MNFERRQEFDCLVVLGPTASGKTRIAVELASFLHGEIISADSRQVYRGLNIGAGKDYEQYIVQGKRIPYHLIDIADPREQFYLQDFISLSREAFNRIRSRDRIPIFCGGTGLYLDSLHKQFPLTAFPENPELRKNLEGISKEELLKKLAHYPAEWISHIDKTSVKRIIRGIEIAEYRTTHPQSDIALTSSRPLHSYYIGILLSREEQKIRISKRLEERMRTGMIEETEELLQSGLTHERLDQLGLEYRYISRFLRGIYNESEMKEKLLTAIFQFAKRQMTWFRKMEKEGVEINWINSSDDFKKLTEKLKKIFVVR